MGQIIKPIIFGQYYLPARLIIKMTIRIDPESVDKNILLNKNGINSKYGGM